MEPTCLGHDVSLQGPDRLVIGIDRSAQTASRLGHVLAERGQALVELASDLLHLTGILGQSILLPSVGDGPQ